MQQLTELILKAHHIVLTTHKQCDGDGLGSELALFHALKSTSKKVTVINVDKTPHKYRFLNPDKHIQYFDSNATLPEKIDLVLVFDTNDERMIEPMYSELQKRGCNVVFVDHHPLLKNGPQPSPASYIDTTAASTGEMTYKLIQNLKLSLDTWSAQALYTSITFDTQLYRFVKNSPQSHLIAAELLQHNIQPEEVHRHLFSNQTVDKMQFLAVAISRIEYHSGNTIALLKLNDRLIRDHNLDPDDVRDMIDMVMNIETLETAVIFREDALNEYKVSLRSKGKFEVLPIAESIGGGGHPFAAGAFVKMDYPKLKKLILDELKNRMQQLKLTGS